MLDTIAATIKPDQRLNIDVFQAGEVVDSVGLAKPRRDKFWLNGGGHLPRVTYWRYDRPEDTGLLKIEFSVPKLAMTPDVGDWNCGTHEIASAISLANLFVWSRIADDLPSVGEWDAQRIDYAFNWRTDKTNEYVQLLSKLSFRSTERRVFPDGVMWVSKTRTLKFYVRKPDVLRFEVSNFRDGCRALATWFDCDRRVGTLARVGRSLYGMAYALDGLGLRDDVPLAGDDDLLSVRLREAFGARNVGTALHVLRCISEHGTAAFKAPLALVSRGMYYTWRAKLLAAGFVLDGGAVQQHALPPLGLPAGAVLNDDFSHACPPQNLDGSVSSGANLSQKIFGPDWAERLEISPLAPACNYFGNRVRRKAAS